MAAECGFRLPLNYKKNNINYHFASSLREAKLPFPLSRPPLAARFHALVLQTDIRVLYIILAEVPGAARVNLQPAEHLKNVSFSFYGFKPPRPRG